MRIRLTQPLKAWRALSNGRAALFFKAGDYEVGTDIPTDVARDALDSGRATRIPEKGERETKIVRKRATKRKRKVARLDESEGDSDSDRPVADSRAD